jgi:hypothetical protein
MTDIGGLIQGLNRRAAATDAQIVETERQLGHRLPSAYVEFLRTANGGEGFIGEVVYVILWRVEELSSLNRDYKVEQCSLRG